MTSPAPWKHEGFHVTDCEGGYVGYLEDFSQSDADQAIDSVNDLAAILRMAGAALPVQHQERLRALARGFIGAKHGRDLTIHGLTATGVAYQIPGGKDGSSTTASWWEVLIYHQTGEIQSRASIGATEQTGSEQANPVPASDLVADSREERG